MLKNRIFPKVLPFAKNRLKNYDFGDVLKGDSLMADGFSMVLIKLSNLLHFDLY